MWLPEIVVLPVIKTVLPFPVTLMPLDLAELEIVFLPWSVAVEGLVLPFVLEMVILVDLLVVMVHPLNVTEEPSDRASPAAPLLFTVESVTVALDPSAIPRPSFLLLSKTHLDAVTDAF